MAGAPPGSLQELQASDPQVDNIVGYSAAVVVYLLEQEGDSPGWQKQDIEGPVFIVKRKALPRYRLLVKNAAGGDNLLDAVHSEWQLDCQESYVFYQTQDTSQKVRGLWFAENDERTRMEQVISGVLEELRSNPDLEKEAPAPAPAAPAPAPAAPAPPPPGPPPSDDDFGPTKTNIPTQSMAVNVGDFSPDIRAEIAAAAGAVAEQAQAGDPTVIVSKDSLKKTLLELGRNEVFLDLILKNIQDKFGPQSATPGPPAAPPPPGAPPPEGAPAAAAPPPPGPPPPGPPPA